LREIGCLEVNLIEDRAAETEKQEQAQEQEQEQEREQRR
jgi:hypothetical protein